MDYKEFKEDLKKIIQPVLDEENIELVELSFVRAGNNSLLRLLVERKDGGINLGDCARLNQKIGSVLDANNTIKDKYILEVSSPGLDRPLETEKDFLRCINKKVKFFLKEAINGKIEIEGLVKKAQGTTVVINIEDGALEIPLSNIRKARQTIK